MLLQTNHNRAAVPVHPRSSLPPTPGSRLGAAPASQAPAAGPALASPGAEGQRASASQPAAGPGDSRDWHTCQIHRDLGTWAQEKSSIL